MPAFLVLKERDPFSLIGFGEDDSGAPFSAARRLKSTHELLHVVAVHFDDIAAEWGKALPVSAKVVAEHSFPALAEPVDVNDDADVVHLVEFSDFHCFIDRAFC